MNDDVNKTYMIVLVNPPIHDDSIAGSSCRTLVRNGGRIRTDEPAAMADASSGKLPTVFAGVCVTFGGTRAPIFGVYATQVTVQVPDVPVGSVPVQISRYCGTAKQLNSVPEVARTAETTPEFLYLQSNPNGRNPVAAYDAVTYEWIGTSKAARPGDYLTIFGVGFGRTTPAVPTGETTTSGAGVTGAVQLTIGGINLRPSELLYVGLSPNSIGLYQVNMRVPNGIESGDQPVRIQIGEAISPPGAYLTIGL